MKPLVPFFFALCLMPFLGGGLAAAHCEIPCGIYHDELRFESMLEDTETIHKAMEQIGELAAKHTAQDMNQLARWVAAKDEHATSTQHVIAQYFMTQRIKASQKDYVERLKAAHAVMVQAMKCKQTVDVTQADALKKAITTFHKVYAPDAAKAHDHK